MVRRPGSGPSVQPSCNSPPGKMAERACCEAWNVAERDLKLLASFRPHNFHLLLPRRLQHGRPSCGGLAFLKSDNNALGNAERCAFLIRFKPCFPGIRARHPGQTHPISRSPCASNRLHSPQPPHHEARLRARLPALDSHFSNSISDVCSHLFLPGLLLAMFALPCFTLQLPHLQHVCGSRGNSCILRLSLQELHF